MKKNLFAFEYYRVFEGEVGKRHWILLLENSENLAFLSFLSMQNVPDDSALFEGMPTPNSEGFSCISYCDLDENSIRFFVKPIPLSFAEYFRYDVFLRNHHGEKVTAIELDLASLYSHIAYGIKDSPLSGIVSINAFPDFSDKVFINLLHKLKQVGDEGVVGSIKPDGLSQIFEVVIRRSK